MSIQKRIKETTLDDIKSLIENKVPEGKTIDYKQSLSLKTDEEKIEFYKDVTAFANAEGGDIIYGVTEEDRFPKEIVGIEISNIDDILLKLQNMIKDGIEQTIIPSPEFTFIKKQDSENRYVLVLRIYKSFTAPHRISFNKDHRFFIRGDHKFFIRGDGANGEMSVTELRNGFILSQTLVERVQKFRLERLHRIISKETPVPLVDKLEGKEGKLVIHVIPLQAFNSNEQIDISRDWEKIKDKIDTMRNWLIDHMITGPMEPNVFQIINLEGMMVASLGNREKERSSFYTYTQLFRNGIVEGVRIGISGNLYIEIDDIWSLATSFVEKTLNLYREMASSSIFQITGPKYVFITLIGIKGYKGIVLNNKARVVNPGIFTDDILQLPEVVLDESNEDKPFGEILNPTYKILLNAFGWVLDDDKK